MHLVRQRLKVALGTRSAKTVDNVLTVLSVLLKTAVEWDVLERVPCLIKLLATPKPGASFHEFEEYERLVKAAQTDPLALLVTSSHLAMRGAPARAIQALAGHQDLATTQRYMHLSPAALDAAIRLLEMGTGIERSRGDLVEAAGTGGMKDCNEAKARSAFALERRPQVLRRDRLRG